MRFDHSCRSSRGNGASRIAVAKTVDVLAEDSLLFLWNTTRLAIFFNSTTPHGNENFRILGTENQMARPNLVARTSNATADSQVKAVAWSRIHPFSEATAEINAAAILGDMVKDNRWSTADAWNTTAKVGASRRLLVKVMDTSVISNTTFLGQTKTGSDDLVILKTVLVNAIVCSLPHFVIDKTPTADTWDKSRSWSEVFELGFGQDFIAIGISLHVVGCPVDLSVCIGTACSNRLSLGGIRGGRWGFKVGLHVG